MNEKITLPLLIQLLSRQTGDTRKQTEDFIKEFFGIIASALAEGDTVKIKSLGVFKTISVGSRKSVNVATGEDNEIPSHRKVVFVPTKEVAALVNEPFEMFETVELDNEVDFEEEEMPEPIAETIPDESQEDYDTDDPGGGEDVVDPEPEPETAPEAEQEVPSEPEQNRLSDDESAVYAIDADDDADVVYVIDAENTADTEPIDVSDTPRQFAEVPEPDDELGCEPASSAAHKKSWRGFLVGFLSGIVFCGLLLLGMYYFGVPGMRSQTVASDAVDSTSGQAGEEPVDSIPAKVAETVDSAASTAQIQPVAESPTGNKTLACDDKSAKQDAAPTSPSDKKVTDVITKTRYLTTMAKDHYGNFNLWPYIYMENQAFIGHPDRIKPGTVIVIPDLRKYGVDPKNPADIAKAKKKGVEIYSRYK